MKYLPLINQLYALQVLEYDFPRFLGWALRNPLRIKLQRKQSLVWTSKAKFLFITSLVIQFLLLIILPFTFSGSGSFHSKGAIVFILLTIFPQPLLFLSLLVLRPYETVNRRRTITQAQRILAGRNNLLVIGITGSYGKTTVKEILAALLSARYKVLATPKSYNTLFGISGIIKNNLKPEHEIFIVEMGAYKRGEIAELCRMVKPKIGILTGITNQHLERFRTLENIAAAKYELIEALPPDGLAVFNLDSSTIIDLYEKTSATPKIGYTKNNTRPNSPSAKGVSQVRLGDILEPSNRQTFDVISNSPLINTRQPITNLTISLSGEHQLSNGLAAVTVALYLNIPSEQIRLGLAAVKSLAHRLQFISQPDGTLIIDDAYSSNPEGARAAVKLVTRLPNHPKIIVTPGMVELGKQQFEENKNFGKLIAENFDYAVIVNKTNRKALLQGIKDGGWAVSISMKQCNNETIGRKLFITDTLDQATKKIIPQLVKPNSLILFENDLPDIYD